MFCPNCRSYVNDETRFCPNCGTFIPPLERVSQPFNQVIEIPPQESLLSGILCILGLLLTIFPIVGIILCAIGLTIAFNKNYRTGKILGFSGIAIGFLLIIINIFYNIFYLDEQIFAIIFKSVA